MSVTPVLGSLRAIDHCVLPVDDLATARDRYEALGFVVAPEGRHPFGTLNACVHFADGSFLEPLAIGDAAQADAAADAGNVFVARDREWRRRRGEGFSALVLRTDDAAADHERFVASGLSAGPMLEFARPSADLAGNVSEARFRLAFAAPEHEALTFLFTCERVGVPAIDRTALSAHRNGVTGVAGVIAIADDPQRASGFLGGLCLPGTVEVIDREEGRARFGRRLGEQGLLFVAIRLQTSGLHATRALLDGAGIGYTLAERGDIVVPPAPGQGAHLIFEDAS
jgi:hypothetical protein